MTLSDHPGTEMTCQDCDRLCAQIVRLQNEAKDMGRERDHLARQVARRDVLIERLQARVALDKKRSA